MAATVRPFHTVNRVAEVGMRPICDSRKCPGVARVSGIDPDTP